MQEYKKKLDENFRLISRFKPKGDQPQAIKKLVDGTKKGLRKQVLLGVTGSGKTFTIAKVIEALQKPTLVISHNKTLAAQLCSEFKSFFPENAAEFFVSYFDYFQPEAYVPTRDLYIDKEVDINIELEKLRYATTASLMSRYDVIVVSSVSCIYGIGSSETYKEIVLNIKKGDLIDRDTILDNLVEMQYSRNDYAFSSRNFRVRGDTIDIWPSYQDTAFRIELFGDEVERIVEFDALKGKTLKELTSLTVYPAKHHIPPHVKIEEIVEEIKKELEERLPFFEKKGKLVEAQRLRERVGYDIEMLLETGYCSGIENYSRYLDGRKLGEKPYTLLDYFPEDFLMIIDESHQTLPQLRGMWGGNYSRKKNLVDYGFRLPSAFDNRPLNFEEFEEYMNNAFVIFVSATPASYELGNNEQVVEQIIRPTGLVDPEVLVRPVENQIDNLIKEINDVVSRNERALVTTLTKRMAEDLAEYLLDIGVKAQYLHSEITALDRIQILRELREGKIEAVVGINLLREGLDLPEVSLVAILDADKEGFLRSETSLIQIMGRAARNVNGHVILYADEMTKSMNWAIKESNRRRKLQLEYNEKHGIVPKTVEKEVKDLLEVVESFKVAEKVDVSPARKGIGLDVSVQYLLVEAFGESEGSLEDEAELSLLIVKLEEAMKLAAQNLEFEKAALIRDKIKELKEDLNNL
ncbi:MAG: excinuclease ABC subunit UvrB [Candidatus Wukongarchaeota archaeon]|nr:excinuclease ABC subunit UvrB [Candidatus Wukongarchaeota archaeon]